MGTLALASTLIAFAGVQWSSDLQRATSSIYAMRPDGTQQHRLSGKGNWTDTNPDWSRDGKRIAFGRMDMRGWRIFVMTAEGRNLRALTSSRPLAEAPTWSPKGRLIAFACLSRGMAAQQICVVTVSSGRIRTLTRFKAGAGAPAWSPDGRRIAFVAWPKLADNVRPDVWTIRPDGSGARRVIRDADTPAWSPDSSRIAFSRDGEIYTVGADGSRLRRITRSPRTGDQEPSWSPDGKQLAFATMHRAADQRNDDMLISVATLGAGLRTIRDGDPLLWMDAPSWEPG